MRGIKKILRPIVADLIPVDSLINKIGVLLLFKNWAILLCGMRELKDFTLTNDKLYFRGSARLKARAVSKAEDKEGF